MRLTKIRILGFKSFAESTVIHFKHDIAAIVGPNGCGKSNIIDAVRWVLGESSVRHLRGKDATDVIFNGSSQRTFTNKATVQLTFDNTEGKLGGEFGRYREIAIEREIYRDGLSQYRINGQVCRRKDVTALFLGSGLGPRSYAIIEQGMISRLIESSPVQLRTYIEEAAAVSRYQEKRKDIERHLAQTQGNLARLNDIKVQMEERLTVLKEQAQQAQQYKDMRTKQRQLRSDLLYHLWHVWTQAARDALQRQSTLEQELQALEKQKTQQEVAKQQNHEALVVANTQLESIHRTHTKANEHRARLEVSYQHWQAQKAQQQQQHEQLQHQFNVLQKQISEEASQHQALSSQYQQCIQMRKQCQLQYQQVQQQVQQSKKLYDVAQQEFEQVSAEKQKIDQQLLLKQSFRREKQSLLDRICAQYQQEKQHQEQQLASNPEKPQSIDHEVNQRVQHCEQIYQQAQAGLKEAGQRQAQAQQKVQTYQLQAREQQTRLQTLEQWLGQEQPDHLLKQDLAIACGWDVAVEVALTHWLSARTISDLNQAGNGCWIAPARCAKQGTLAEKIASRWFPESFNAIYTVESLAQARVKQPCLQVYESVITPQGDWLGANWIMQVELGKKRPVQWMLERQKLQKEEQITHHQLQSALVEHTQAQAHYTQIQQALITAEDALQQAKQVQQKYQQDFLRAKMAYEHGQQRIEQLQQKLIKLQAEQAQLEQQVQELMQDLTKLDGQQKQAKSVQEQAQQTLQRYNAQWRKERFYLEQVDRKQERLQQDEKNIQADIRRIELLQKRTEQDYQHVISKLNQLETFTQNVTDYTQEIADAQQQVAQQQQQLENCQQQQREYFAKEKQYDAEISELQRLQKQGYAQLQESKLALERAQSRARGVVEQLEEMGLITPTADQIPGLSDTLQAQMKQELTKLEADIKALGAVNLVALDEFQELLDKKRYLDEQHTDLTQAITTLEGAIARIDQESEACFNETFVQVNEYLSSIFRHIFGGGNAWLERVQMQDASCGVLFKATLPGKRNASVSLLSGGEKTLISLALIFAFFQLNPAPFCLLDEVDAPLDDANVLRFGKLLESMAQQVQFVFISHNQASIEASQQLIGVTMQEAGVSRVVSVDVQSAIQWAKA